MKSFQLCVIGAGYVGLSTAACFAELGNKVVCVDKDKAKIHKLKRGRIPIHEPGLGELVQKNMLNGRLSFTSNIIEGLKFGSFIFVAVGTPRKKNGEADLRALQEIVKTVGRFITKGQKKTVVIKSTVPVGTTGEIEKTLGKENIDVVFNPEFLREGTAVEDSFYPDRIVIGTNDPNVQGLFNKLYQPLLALGESRPPLIFTDLQSAEMIKYASNAFLATKISFINEIAHLCEQLGADIKEVSNAMRLDKRIGPHFLSAGLGYGGSCFPKDTRALDHLANSRGHNFHLLRAVIDVNNNHKFRFLEKIEKELKGLRGKTIGVLGLAFKPKTDDIRESISIDIIKILIKKGVRVKAYDPKAMPATKKILNGVKFCRNAYEAAQGGDAVLLVTEWDEFADLDLKKMGSLMEKAIIFDGRNLYDPKKVRNSGFVYHGVGR
ncbi:MAG: UDP-glucose/GDP-mannose dehydrogenase family protein [bacterium]